MDIETHKPLNVLLIDDDEDDYLIVKKIFSTIANSPFTLEWCSSYESGLARINDDAHDAYLVDYRLGEHTGLDLLRTVEPEKRAQPFILLTGAGDREIELRSMRLAAADYLVKGSFDAHALSRTILYAVQRKVIERQQLEHLIEINRTKDEFISVASHQLRTPATGVKQYVGMLLEGFIGELTPRQHEILTKAYESNERQLRIVSDLLKVAQVDAGKVLLHKTEENINTLVGDIVKEQQATFKRRHQSVVVQELAPEQLVSFDKGLVRMVLENIIDNASKYSNDDTTITITISDSPKLVEIAISDQGVGIDERDMNRLFEKFSRIDNALSTKVGGTGLGLYWAKKIIDLHKGTITCQSRDHAGTTFRITLPKAPNV